MSIRTTKPSVFEADLPTLAYDITATPQDIYPQFRAAQDVAPIALGPIGPEVLSYDLARAILGDPRFGIPPGIHLTAHGVTSGELWDRVTRSILCMEGAEHRRLRSLVSRAFTPRATARMDVTIHTVMNDLIDAVEGDGRCEFVEAVARPYPIPVICALLGAPSEDWKLFSRWAEDIFKVVSFDIDLAAEEPAVLRAWDAFDEYIDDMIAHRRTELTHDLLSELIRAEHDGDRLDAAEVRMLAFSILLAGTDTTRTQLGASMQVLCDHSEQLALLRDRPELAMNAVEETMRHSPSMCSTLRSATEDVTIGEYTIPAGTFVLVNTFAANRDPVIYDDPTRFDITRGDPPPILTFGGGAHYCLGANLARRELAEALKILAVRMPNPRLTGPAPWRPLLGMSGPTSLPIEFG
ncbi:cytochrome [Mycolicibacterium celeriflavum]|uniref:cytochrome P450 n=1 Tax=Mycolicibacterium celeriflavum TaxID=1249101 RepID=UPI0008008DFF|nr:cytochrome P450 [Mycolicibacterium celeriflavum]OBG14379.1 cytochrome [Mycolicibacterium celeriflavum]